MADSRIDAILCPRCHTAMGADHLIAFLESEYSTLDDRVVCRCPCGLLCVADTTGGNVDSIAWYAPLDATPEEVRAGALSCPHRDIRYRSEDVTLHVYRRRYITLHAWPVPHCVTCGEEY